jgi:hypothetical protein
MTGKKKGYLSLSEASDLLKAAFGGRAKSEQNKGGAEGSPKASKSEQNPFADMERAMVAKGMAQGEQGSARRQALKGKGKKKKGKNKQPNAKAVADLTPPKPPKLKPMGVLLKAPGMKSFYKKLLAEQEGKQPAETPPSAQPNSGASAAERSESIKRIRDIVGNLSPAIEKRTTAISDDTAQRISRAISVGAERFAQNPERDVDGGFIVGFDFGTSSLKLAVRQPYQAGDREGKNVVAMPAPAELRSGNHPYLWQTVIWFDPGSECFSLFPKPGSIALEGFKTGIIGGRGGERVVPDVPVTRSEAAIAFIAMQLAHFFGWYAEERPLKEIGGDRHLSINIGIPVAAHDDERSYKVFQHIVDAARVLVSESGELSLSKVRSAHQKSSNKLPYGWEIIAELTAAIAGYAADSTSQPGSHVLIDVGASTLDIVTFNLVDRKSIAVISAGVELLGAASFNAALESGASEQDFRHACNAQFNAVFGHACRWSRGGNGFHPQLRARDVQLITTGGGCATQLHADFIQSKNTPNVLGTAAIVQPEPPTTCASEACDLSRLLLAYGLTRDVPELLELKLPSQVPSITRPNAPGVVFIDQSMT